MSEKYAVRNLRLCPRIAFAFMYVRQVLPTRRTALLTLKNVSVAVRVQMPAHRVQSL